MSDLVERIRDAVNRLNPWREARLLREQNARLWAMIDDPMITGLQIGNGGIRLGVDCIAAKLLAGMFLGMFEKYPDAKNYIEVTLGSPHGTILVTVTKPNGKTPHQLRLDAEEKLSTLMESMKQ